MQLARELFLTKEVTLERKFKEMILALRLENIYSKEEILTYYVNQIFLVQEHMELKQQQEDILVNMQKI